MPKTLDFKLISTLNKSSEINKILYFATHCSSSRYVNCTQCTNRVDHKMRDERYICQDSTCNSFDDCPCKFKVLTCQNSNKTKVYQLNEHNINEHKLADKKERGIPTRIKTMIEYIIEN